MDKTVKTLAGEYVLLTTYAVLTEDEKLAAEEWDAAPLARTAIGKDFLASYSKAYGCGSLKSFLSQYNMGSDSVSSNCG